MYFSFMQKILYIIFISLIVVNCSFKEVVKHHGVPYLEKKQESLKVNETNKNDIIKILGAPSTKSKFDNDVWIYIDQNQIQPKIKNLGKMKISKNDILVLEIDRLGVLRKKNFYNKNTMNELKIDTNETGKIFRKNSFIYNFFSSLRQKVNDPLGKRAKKRKEINQR